MAHASGSLKSGEMANDSSICRIPSFVNGGLMCSTASSSGRSSGTVGSGECVTMGKETLACSKLKRKSQRNWLTCSVCNKKFDRPSLLKRHMRTHTGEKPHACDVCGKAFSTSSSLNTHRRIHSGEKPHACATCGKRFTASSNLYYHRMTHNKEKPHKCHQCPKSFPTPGDLRNHMYVHNAEWPFKCPICQRGFSKVTNLKNHLYLHNGEKPFECEKCGKKFALHCNLKAHARTHEKGGSDFAYDSVVDERRDELLASNQQVAITEHRLLDCQLATRWMTATPRSACNRGPFSIARTCASQRRTNNFRSIEELAVSAYCDGHMYDPIACDKVADVSDKSIHTEANNNDDLPIHAANALDMKLYCAALQSMPLELFDIHGQSGLLSLLKPLQTLANMVANSSASL